MLPVAHAQVRFEQTKDLNILLAKAKKENKLLFIDGYTDWCGWCKVLDKKVFCNGAVADSINKYFICGKLEMQKDSFGILLSRKFTVNGFPTALILTKDGHLVNALAGYSPPEEYLTRITPFFNPEIVSTVKGYSNNLTPNFPTFYLNVFPFAEKGEYPDSVTVNTFLNERQEFSDEVSWAVIKRFYYQLDLKQQKRVLESVPILNDAYGTKDVQTVIYSMFYDYAFKAIKANNDTAYKNTMILAKQFLPEDFGQLAFSTEKFHLQKDSNWLGVAQLIQKTKKDSSITLSPETLNDIAWTMYEKCKDKAALKMAIDWMENDVIKKDPQYAYWDTYAAVLFKYENYPAAKKAAEVAILVGNEKQEDVSETENLLKKINAKIKK